MIGTQEGRLIREYLINLRILLSYEFTLREASS